MKTIKGNQRGRGGARRGAGRKPGSANVKTREIANKAAAAGITPLEYMLNLMRKQTPEGADPTTQVKYDDLRFEASKAAAPYIHPRCANRDNPIDIGTLTGNLAEQGGVVLGALSGGKITPSEAATVMQALASQARIVEVSDLERRMAALEEKINAKATGRGYGRPGGAL